MNPLFLIFIGIPAIEIFLLIKIGGQLGALNTVALIFLTAIIGIYFAKHQGIRTLRSGMVNLYQNKMLCNPTGEKSIRLRPHLTVTEKEFDKAYNLINGVLNE